MTGNYSLVQFGILKKGTVFEFSGIEFLKTGRYSAKPLKNCMIEDMELNPEVDVMFRAAEEVFIFRESV